VSIVSPLRFSRYGVTARISSGLTMSSEGMPSEGPSNNVNDQSSDSQDNAAAISPPVPSAGSSSHLPKLNLNEEFITGINDVKAIIAKMKLADKANQVGISINSLKSTAMYTQMRKFLLKTKNLLTGNGFTEVASSENQKNILTDLGLNALLAYGFVSNLSYITCTWLAWLSHSKATKTSPLYPGQWKVFLTFYAGYW